MNTHKGKFMKIAVAQTELYKGEIEKSIKKHVKYAIEASEIKAL